MSLSRDTLLFSIVLMLVAVQIETSGYGDSGAWMLGGLLVAFLGMLGSLASSIRLSGET